MIDHFYKSLPGETWFDYENVYREIVVHSPDNSTFVEVGSWKGRSAAFLATEIHNSGKNIKLHCVDTWKGSISPEHGDAEFHDPYVVAGTLLQHFWDNVKPVAHVITAIEKPSLEAAKDYENESLEFVFIDASHLYEDVKNDILAWYPKVKKDGIIAGHDYISPAPEVRKIVDEIFPNVSSSGTCWMYQKK